MARKQKKVEQEKGSVPEVKAEVSGMVELTASNGSLNKYGKRNVLRHGRHAQGGQIDQLVFKSFLTGKTVTFDECSALNLKEAVSNPLNQSRIDSHLQHLVGSHGFKILINQKEKLFQVKGIGDIDPAVVKSQCDIL
jgi:hypothetical protein